MLVSRGRGAGEDLSASRANYDETKHSRPLIRQLHVEEKPDMTGRGDNFLYGISIGFEIREEASGCMCRTRQIGNNGEPLEMISRSILKGCLVH
jgi:hypothetical protein